MFWFPEVQSFWLQFSQVYLLYQVTTYYQISGKTQNLKARNLRAARFRSELHKQGWTRTKWQPYKTVEKMKVNFFKYIFENTNLCTLYLYRSIIATIYYYISTICICTTYIPKKRKLKYWDTGISNTITTYKIIELQWNMKQSRIFRGLCLGLVERSAWAFRHTRTWGGAAGAVAPLTFCQQEQVGQRWLLIWRIALHYVKKSALDNARKETKKLQEQCNRMVNLKII